jgi:hypothetical protein
MTEAEEQEEDNTRIKDEPETDDQWVRYRRMTWTALLRRHLLACVRELAETRCVADWTPPAALRRHS